VPKKDEAQLLAEKKKKQFESDVEQVLAMRETENFDDIAMPQVKEEQVDKDAEVQSEPEARDSFYEELWERQHPEAA